MIMNDKTIKWGLREPEIELAEKIIQILIENKLSGRKAKKILKLCKQGILDCELGTSVGL